MTNANLLLPIAVRDQLTSFISQSCGHLQHSTVHQVLLALHSLKPAETPASMDVDDTSSPIPASAATIEAPAAVAEALPAPTASED